MEQGDLLIAAAEEFEDRRNMTLQEVTVDKNYKWNGKYLHEITIPGGTLIVMIRRALLPLSRQEIQRSAREMCLCWQSFEAGYPAFLRV